MRAVESDVTLSDIGNVTSKKVLNTIIYSYDSEGNLAKKRIIPNGSAEQIVSYVVKLLGASTRVAKPLLPIILPALLKI